MTYWFMIAKLTVDGYVNISGYFKEELSELEMNVVLKHLEEKHNLLATFDNDYLVLV